MMAASSLLNWSISRNPFSPNVRKESWFLFVITELKTVTTTCWSALDVRSLHSGGSRGSAEFSNHPALPRGLCTNSEEIQTVTGTQVEWLCRAPEHISLQQVL